jgi:hypothetical protein
MASLSPSPVMLLMPLLGEPATNVVTLFAQNGDGLRADQAGAPDNDNLHGLPRLSTIQSCNLAKNLRGFRTDVNTEAVGLVQLNSATLGEFAVPAWHPGKLRMKLLDLRTYDRDVAAELAVRIEQR